MTMNIETKIEINIKKDISDMICLMDGRVIVVEMRGKVNILTSDGKLQKQLPIPGEPYSVTQINQNTIAITYPSEAAIRIFNMENETVTKVIKLDKRMQRVIFSDYHGNAVYCVDKSGKEIWRYKQDLSQPEGLCTDTYGNIIVADCYSHRILVISKDGQNSKVLISEEDGLDRPMCICFKHNESSGFICNEDGTYLAKFNLTS
ncbi:TRIM2_3 [Mytilus coruscus]|uniref:TRIM2_3 n=1 Tax=Mytilus coruscus TaxID=42192 RepID=A0A6J8BPI1_MYTCO|nr:TRIM2_3 [Mytilus coruscus]